MEKLKISLFCFIVSVSLLISPYAYPAEEKPLNVVVSFYPVYIMAINVAKGVPGVSVSCLANKSIGCLHDYSLTTKDMRMVAGADILIANGAGAEPFLDSLISGNPGLKVVKLSDEVVLIKNAKGVNPHTWVSVSNAIIETRNLGSAMQAIDPAHSKLYRNNTDAYVSKLEALRAQILSEAGRFKNKKIITFHEAFSYFAKEFGIEVVAVIEREPGSEPSARELAETIKLVRQSGIGSLFTEPQYSAGAAMTIAKETGSKIYILDPAVTGPDDPDAYLETMEINIKVLKKALS